MCRSRCPRCGTTWSGVPEHSWEHIVSSIRDVLLPSCLQHRPVAEGSRERADSLSLPAGRFCRARHLCSRHPQQHRFHHGDPRPGGVSVQHPHTRPADQPLCDVPGPSPSLPVISPGTTGAQPGSSHASRQPPPAGPRLPLSTPRSSPSSHRSQGIFGDCTSGHRIPSLNYFRVFLSQLRATDSPQPGRSLSPVRLPPALLTFLRRQSFPFFLLAGPSLCRNPP